MLPNEVYRGNNYELLQAGRQQERSAQQSVFLLADDAGLAGADPQVILKLVEKPNKKDVE